MAVTSKASHARHIKTLLTYLKNNPSNKQVKQQCLEYINKLASKDKRVKAYLSLAQIYVKSYPAEALRYLQKIIQLDKKNSTALKMMQAAHHYKKTAAHSEHHHPHQQKTVARGRPSRQHSRNSSPKTLAAQPLSQEQRVEHHDSQTMYSSPMINLDANRVKSLKKMTLSGSESASVVLSGSVVESHPTSGDHQGSFLATDEDIDFDQLHESVTAPDQPAASPLEILPFDEPSVAASLPQITSVDAAEAHIPAPLESAATEEEQALATQAAEPSPATTDQDEHTGSHVSTEAVRAPDSVAAAEDAPPAVAMGNAQAAPHDHQVPAGASEVDEAQLPAVAAHELLEAGGDPHHADLLLSCLAHLIDSGQAYLVLTILASLTEMADTTFDQGLRRAMLECYLQANSCLNRLVPTFAADELARLSHDDAVDQWKNLLLTVAHSQSEYAIAI